MKRFFIMLLIFTFVFLNFACKKSANNETNSNSGHNNIVMQKEMMEILERNVDNPKNALVELEGYYAKYAQTLKKQLQIARQNMQTMRNQYQNNLHSEEKVLSERQMAAIQKLLKIEPNFNIKLMEIMRKHGLLGDN